MSLTSVLLFLCRCHSLIVWVHSQSAALSGPEDSVPTVRPWTSDLDGCRLSAGELYISCCWPDWCCLLIQRVSTNTMHIAHSSVHMLTLLQLRSISCYRACRDSFEIGLKHNTSIKVLHRHIFISIIIASVFRLITDQKSITATMNHYPFLDWWLKHVFGRFIKSKGKCRCLQRFC